MCCEIYIFMSCIKMVGISIMFPQHRWGTWECDLLFATYQARVYAFKSSWCRVQSGKYTLDFVYTHSHSRVHTHTKLVNVMYVLLVCMQV